MGYFKINAGLGIVSFKPCFSTRLIGSSCRTTLSSKGERTEEPFRVFPNEGGAGDLVLVDYQVTESVHPVLFHIKKKDNLWRAEENPYEVEKIVSPEMNYQTAGDFFQLITNGIRFTNDPEAVGAAGETVMRAGVDEMLLFITKRIKLSELKARSVKLAKTRAAEAELRHVTAALNAAQLVVNRQQRALDRVRAERDELSFRLDGVAKQIAV